MIRGFRRMSALRNLQGHRKSSVVSACGYFKALRHRMRYHEYLAAGYPIATGLIEGACRHLFKDRLECCGMRWIITGRTQYCTNLALSYTVSLIVPRPR